MKLFSLAELALLKTEQRWQKFPEGLSQPCHCNCQSLTCLLRQLAPAPAEQRHWAEPRHNAAASTLPQTSCCNADICFL